MKQLFLCLLMSGPFCLGGDGMDAGPILNGYLKALGGAEAIASLKSLQKEGLYVFNGLDHPLQMWHKENKVRSEIEGLTQYGSSVVKGEKEVVVWASSANQPIPSNKVRSAAEIKATAFLTSSLLWHHLNAKGTIVSKGKTKLEGVAVFRLLLTREDGTVEDWFLNAKTYLPFKKTVSSSEMFSPHGWIFDDYRKVGKLVFPHYVEIEEGLFTRTYLFEKIEINPDIPDTHFKL